MFPVTDRANDVLTCFEKKLNKQKINIKYETRVINISKDEEKNNFTLYTNKGTFKADKVIIATGGKSYPKTGSTGDGYNLAKKLGHTITKIKPSLVPIEIYEYEVISRLQGLSLKNVTIKIIDKTKNKLIYEDFGEMLFTHFGVSGPIILSSSAHLIRYKDIEELLKNKNLKLLIDFKPALDNKKLDLRIRRDFEELKNKKVKNSLDKLLPQKLIPVVINLSKISFEKQVNCVTKDERQNLVNIIKNFSLTLKDFRHIEEAIITSGGINTKEINPKTMESKIIKGLYFAGEIIDVDAYTGGFNLQIAYSTGYVAGKLN